MIPTISRSVNLFLFIFSTLFISWQPLHGQESFRKQLQTQLIMAEAGDTIIIPEGSWKLSASLSLDEKSDITILGAGKDLTILSFKGQEEGAEGLRISNSKNITLKDFTVQDAKGDCIKAIETKDISFLNLRTEWTGRPKKTNGSYALYPVSCSNVLIDGCEAVGSSDAGIYVGQSHNIVVRNSTAYNNVAGIEIENSTMAEVYNCTAYDNTGGIMVFDLPGLPKKKGGKVRIHNNIVRNNNYRNFAPGGIVEEVPPGTGIMVMATSEVEVFDNVVTDNQTFGITVVSYKITQRKIKDKEYDPYPKSVFIHDNAVQNSLKPTTKSPFGLLLRAKFRGEYPDIVLGGIFDPNSVDTAGNLKSEHRICVQNNGTARFGFLDAGNDFENLHTDASKFDCKGTNIPEPELSKTK